MALYDVPAGTYVSSVMENGSAAKAGIKPGDIITTIDGKSIKGIQALSDDLAANYKVGDSAELTLFRNGSSITVTVVLQDYNSINRF
jgi:serine protease Do